MASPFSATTPGCLVPSPTHRSSLWARMAPAASGWDRQRTAPIRAGIGDISPLYPGPGSVAAKGQEQILAIRPDRRVACGSPPTTVCTSSIRPLARSGTSWKRPKKGSGLVRQRRRHLRGPFRHPVAGDSRNRPAAPGSRSGRISNFRHDGRNPRSLSDDIIARSPRTAMGACGSARQAAASTAGRTTDSPSGATRWPRPPASAATS